MTPDSETIRCLWALYGAPREDLERELAAINAELCEGPDESRAEVLFTRRAKVRAELEAARRDG